MIPALWLLLNSELDESQSTQINKSLYTSQPPQTDPHSGGRVHDKAVVADVAPMADLGFESNDHNTVVISTSSTKHPPESASSWTIDEDVPISLTIKSLKKSS